MAQGFVQRNPACRVEFEQVLVKGLHAVGFRTLHQAHHLDEFSLHHKVLHGRGVHQQIDDGGTPAFFQACETLADDADHVQRQIQEHLLVLFFGIQVHDTLNCLHGVVGMDGEEA